MSHLVTVDCKIDSIEALSEALVEMGYEPVRNATISSRYWNDKKVDLGIRKDGKTITIGWVNDGNDTYDLIADWFCTGINQGEFVEAVNVGHTKHKTSSWMKKNGYSVKYETNTDGNLVVVGTRW